MIICRTCNQDKSENEFGDIRSTYLGVTGETIKYSHKRLDCKSCHAEKKYEKKLHREYNITLQDFDNLILKQENCCAICHTEFESRSKAFVDHCHTTMKVRGLLCSKCNFGIGQFNDDTDLLLQAIEYLKA